MKEQRSLAEVLEKLESNALAAMAQNREVDAIHVWRQIVSLAPTHARGWTVLGQILFRRGEFHPALEAFTQAAQVDGSDPRQWTSVAFACQRLDDDAAEEAALFKALSVDASDLLALLLRGRLFDRLGRNREASVAYGAALAVAPPTEKLSPDMRQALAEAQAFREQHERAFAEHIESFLSPVFDRHAGANLDRFRLSIDVMAGRKRRYESMPSLYWFPNLPRAEFFERSQFDWIESVEAHGAAVRDEFSALDPKNNGFVPYIQYRSDQPVEQWKTLNESTSWSAFHLIKNGLTVPENAARCPQTMTALSAVPSPRQAGRTPVAMFSVLQPHTRIPPHVGASNARLVAHLPLIVPAGCGFRVGNSECTWVPGQVLVFDDTVEHEAWNDSAHPRSVLIFDVWHPALSLAEREMITALSEGMNAFGNADAGAFSP